MDLLRTYHAWAFELELMVGSDALIHVCAGLAILLIGAALMRRSLSDPWVLVPVILLEGANELVDWLDGYGWTPDNTLTDISWTMAWPCIVVIYCRWRWPADRAAAETR